MPHFHNSERFKPPEIRKNLLNRVLGKSEDANAEAKSKSLTLELPEIQSGIEDEEGTTFQTLVLLDDINPDAPEPVKSSNTPVLPSPKSTLYISTLPLPNTQESQLEVDSHNTAHSLQLLETGEGKPFISITKSSDSVIKPTSVSEDTPLFDFDGDVPNPSPVLLEDIYDDSITLQPLTSNFIDFDLDLDEEESISEETFLPAELSPINRLQSEDIKSKPLALSPPLLQPSFTSSPSPSTEASLSSAQLEYLQLLGLPAELPDLQPLLVTLTQPVVTTEEQFSTQTLTLGLGGKEVVTTLVQPLGLTTRTSFTTLTTTLPSLSPFPSTTIISSPVVVNTVVTQTDIQQYRILFRNRPITTTLTSTRLVTTMATSYVVQTVTLQPANPFLGILRR